MQGIVSAVAVMAAFAVVAGAACAAAGRLYRMSRRVQPAAPDQVPEPADG